jgi:protein ImuB
MPLAEAQSLARELGVAAYDAAADRRALTKLAEACEQFSPRVAVEEGEEPESLLLDISNLEHLYGSEVKLIGLVEKFFKRRRYHVRLAVAETVGAVWAAAHCECSNDECRMTNVGKIYSSLPIESLRVASDTSALLRQLGIETVDQLLALPREELTSRFGDELLLRLDQLTGRGRELIEPQRGLPPFEVSYALEEPTGDRGVLMHVLEHLVVQLSQQLAARDQGAVVLMCLLHLPNSRPRADRQPPALPGVLEKFAEQEPPAEPGAVGVHEIVPSGCLPLRIGLLQPSANARQLLELIELHLENVRLPDEIDRVELRALVTGRLGERQRELFADRWPTDPHQVALLMNRLSSRLGVERVLRAELRKSPLPERAVGWEPVVESRIGDLKRRRNKETRRQGDKGKQWKSNSPCPPLSLSPCLPPRPLTLHPNPEAMEVVSVAPDGPPQFVWMGRHRERIVGCVGPERIETLWWRGPSVRRDYYLVATESGGHLWMFRQLTDGKWFVHGIFD